MLLFEHARVFFSRFLLSRNYKIQVIAHVGRKSAVVLSGTMEASYPHFFIGIDFDRFSRIHFPPLRSKGGKPILEKWSRQPKRMLRISNHPPPAVVRTCLGRVSAVTVAWATRLAADSLALRAPSRHVCDYKMDADMTPELDGCLL